MKLRRALPALVRGPIFIDRGFLLRVPAGTTVDVYFDDRRVWSFPADSYPSGPKGLRRVPWPRLLRQFLSGSAAIEFRDHHSGEVLAQKEHAFGAGEGRVHIADPHGNLLIVDKWGFLQRPFSLQDPAITAEMLDATERVLDVLNNECQVPAWIGFGSLLGAVREGKLIGHDNDIDVAYLSRHNDPVDVAREMFSVSRALQAKGFPVSVKTGSFVTAKPRSSIGLEMPIDVYACFYVGDILYETASVAAPVPRSAVVPLGTVELEGRTFPAPADPDALLAASYGPSWRVPDPGFRYDVPETVKERFRGWFGSNMKRKRMWQRIYSGAYDVDIPRAHSNFSTWVRPQLQRGATVLDVGCGNGRDALWFARHNHRVVGLDFAAQPLHRAGARARKAGLAAEFQVLNLYDLRDTLSRAAILLRDVPGPRNVYARFLLHALEPDGREALYRFTDMVLRGKGLAFFEFRTHRDETRRHVNPTHYREFLQPDEICAEIERAGGTIVKRIEGTGLALYGDEDPDVCRLKVRWQR